MKKALLVLLVALIAMGSIFASGSGEKADGKALIGVSMPTKSLQRWNQDGDNMKKQLEAAGYEVDLQYAGDNDIPTQVANIENMISKGCKAIVVAAVDGFSLSEVLAQAKAEGITVISYDRLIMNSDAVSYYATFDNDLVGVMQGKFIEEALNLKANDGKTYNIEMFTGDPADNNINFFFGGAMKVLKPYIDNGKLIVLSGQTAQAQVATPNWSSEEAQKRMENLITAQGYGPAGTKLDAVLCSNDSTAYGAIVALQGVGYTADNFPVVTGQDCDTPNVKLLQNGTQSMSVFKDTRDLASKVVGMVDAIVKGSAPEINDRVTYDNGTGIIPSYLCSPVSVTTANMDEVLFESGYYNKADF